jgi:hypothetical protein
MRALAVDLRDAFLAASVSVLPDVVWREVSSCELEYPTPSPSLGILTVAFESDQITLYFGHHHLHFPHYGGDIRESTRQAAAEALSFIRDLTTDAIVARWVPCASWTVRASRSSGVFWRVLRHLYPGVHEAVWSGTRPEVR